MTIEVLVAILLVCLGILLGTTWTTQALQPRLRRQAEERRRLNEEWSAVRTAPRQRGTCSTASIIAAASWARRILPSRAPARGRVRRGLPRCTVAGRAGP
ncbi:MAG TPA: hypothetical protein VHH52_08785 [Pseudonocardiaceae bacterium]|nr:hypothetical protein [Pseudonocardiaceae bacterium]